MVSMNPLSVGTNGVAALMWHHNHCRSYDFVTSCGSGEFSTLCIVCIVSSVVLNPYWSHAPWSWLLWCWAWKLQASKMWRMYVKSWWKIVKLVLIMPDLIWCVRWIVTQNHQVTRLLIHTLDNRLWYVWNICWTILAQCWYVLPDIARHDRTSKAHYDSLRGCHHQDRVVNQFTM